MRKIGGKFKVSARNQENLTNFLSFDYEVSEVGEMGICFARHRKDCMVERIEECEDR